MSKWLKVEMAGASASYLKWSPSSLAVGNGFSLEFDLVFPADTATALLAASDPNWAADWFLIGIDSGSSPNLGGMYAQVDTGPIVTALNDLTPNAPNGTIPQDAIVHIEFDFAFVSGTDWDFIYKVNGTTVDSYTRTTGSVTTSSNWSFLEFGGPNAGGYTDEVYYLSNVLVKDSGGSTIFSDDFTDVTFPSTLGPWTSKFNQSGHLSIVDAPPVADTPDFTISATPTSVTHTTPGSLTVEIDVGEVTSPETVDLTVDDSGLPFGVSASLDISTGTTPYSATLTLKAIAGATCDDGEVIVSGYDGTNTHSVTIPVTIDGTAGTYDELGAAGAQAGSDMSQTGNYIAEGTLCVYKGELYFAWTESAFNGTPYVAKWNGSDWDLIADGSVFGVTLIYTGTAGCLHVQLATDGDNLFFAFTRMANEDIEDCRGFGLQHYTPYFAEVWQFDGSSWTYLGNGGGGSVVNYAGDSSFTALELAAGPEEPGACYTAFFEEGFEGAENLTWFSRHLTVAGFGTSTFGSIGFDGLLAQFPRDTDPVTVPGGEHCVSPDGATAEGFSMRLVGTGDTLVLYSQAYDYAPIIGGPTYWEKIDVWTPAGITEIDLATDLPHDDLAGTFVGYGPPVFVSEQDIADRRWVGVSAFTSFSSGFKVIRQTTAPAPATFGPTFGLVDASADHINSPINKLVGEPGNLWGVATGSSGNVLLLTDRCGEKFWAASSSGYQLPSGVDESFTDPVIFDDAIWLAGGSGWGDVRVVQVPICRDCGECCSLRGGLRAWQRF